MAPAPELRTLGDVFTRVGSVAAPLLEPCRAGATFAGIEMEHDVLSLILGQLAARELMALGQTCRALRALAAQVPPPGLRLSLFPHQRASLAWMLRQEGDAPHRSGILADEPGLGKTITVSALLCATAGMWTQPEPCPRALVLARDEREWAALAFTYRRQAVSKVLSLLRCAHPAEFALFAMDGKAAAQELPGYADVVHAAPTDYQCVAKDAAVASYATLASFDAALRAVTDNALSYWSSEIPSQFPAAVDVCAAARALASALDGALATLRGPAAAVARLPSRCTLVVVPRPLLRHWREQLTWHVQRSGEGAPQSEVGGEGGEEEKKGGEEQQRQQGLGLVGEVLFDSFGDDCADAAAERLASAVAAGFANPLASRTAAAIAARELPEGGAARLARASVFVTTAERLAGEERRHGGGSSLLRLQWLRLVVDEGHLISAGSLTFAKQFLHRVYAERRWILSGTPARETAASQGARQLGALLGFLKHPLAATFNASLARPFARGVPGSADSLATALRACMVRHLKKDTPLPAPERRTVTLRCSSEEKLAYNTIVAYVRANLVLTAMEGLERGAGWESSLLHPANAASARRALNNVRETCNGGGEQVALLAAGLYDETVLLLQERYRASDAAVGRAESFMRDACAGRASPCDCCGVLARLHLLLPLCAHVVCAECVSPATVACPACALPLPELSYHKCAKCESPRCAHSGPLVEHVENAVDAFAYLQPGFELEWLETRRERAAEQLAKVLDRERARAKAAALRGGSGSVAGLVMGLVAGSGAGAGASSNGMAAAAPSAPASSARPSVHFASDVLGGESMSGASGDANEDESAGLQHSKAGYVIRRLEQLRADAKADSAKANSPKAADKAIANPTIYSAKANSPKAGANELSLKKEQGAHSSCGGCSEATRGAGFHSPFGKRPANAPATVASPLHAASASASTSPGLAPGGPRVVIYSESRRALNVVGHFLVLRFGEEAIAQFWGSYRGSELDKFRSRSVRFWKCAACPARRSPTAHAHAEGAGGDWREVEWPEVRCNGRHVSVALQLPPEVLLLAAPPAAPAVLPAAGAPPVAAPPPPKVLVNEEDLLEHAPGVRWSVGQLVHAPLGALLPALRDTVVVGGHAPGGWVRGRVDSFQKCNAGIPAGVALSERPVDCFVLLLARDGSHGLDLSMVSHIFLIDKIWDSTVEAQVVSRAFRMGATRAVCVEQLLMGGTIEAIMHADATGGGDGDDGVLAMPTTAGKRPAPSDPDHTPPGKRAALPDFSGGAMATPTAPSAAQQQHAAAAGGSGRRLDDGRVTSLLSSLAFIRD